jgi:hypothetical protein
VFEVIDMNQEFDLHATYAENCAKEDFLSRAEPQYHQVRNRYQDYRDIEANVERSCYQVKRVLIYTIVRRARAVP